MPRHKLSLNDEIAGTRAALRSPHTPWQLRPSLKSYLSKLLKKAASQHGEKSHSVLVGQRFRRLTRLGRGERGTSRAIVVALLALALVVGILFAPSRGPRMVQAQTFAVQQGFFNSVFSSNGTLLKTITPSALGSVRIYSVGAYCSPAGTGGQLVVQVMPLTATGLWNSGPFDVGSNLDSVYWPTPLQGPPGTPVVIQVANCNGGGNSNVTLEFQYSVD